MDRRTFLKSGMAGLAALFAAKSGIVTADVPDDFYDYTSEIDDLPHKKPEDFIHQSLASGSKEKVGLRLVCLFDASGSIDNIEHDYQLQAMAKAIASEDFRNAVNFIGGPQSIAITIADFSDDAAVRVPWLDIRKGQDYKYPLLADEIRKIERRTSMGTDHVIALEQAMACYRQCPWEGERNVVDLMTDGSHLGWGRSLDYTRDHVATDYEATINALVTLDYGEEDLDEWAKENLVTLPGFFKKDGRPLDPGFVKIVATQQSSKNPGALVEYHEAMELAFRRKLVLEVAGIELEQLHEVIAAEPDKQWNMYQGFKPKNPNNQPLLKP